MLRTAVLALLCALALPLPARAAAAKDTLVIGVAQFPSSLNPFIDPEVVKTYALDFVVRPLTSFDKDWKLVCLLCTELPTVQNGGARFEDRPDGTRGMAVTFTLRPGLAWGDGTPVTSDDVAFTWKVGRDPRAGVASPHSWANVEAVERLDAERFVLHLRKPDTEYNQWDAILPPKPRGPPMTRRATPAITPSCRSTTAHPRRPGCMTGHT